MKTIKSPHKASILIEGPTGRRGRVRANICLCDERGIPIDNGELTASLSIADMRVALARHDSHWAKRGTIA